MQEKRQIDIEHTEDKRGPNQSYSGPTEIAGTN
jgi:hypothetical protein